MSAGAHSAQQRSFWPALLIVLAAAILEQAFRDIPLWFSAGIAPVASFGFLLAGHLISPPKRYTSLIASVLIMAYCCGEIALHHLWSEIPPLNVLLLVFLKVVAIVMWWIVPAKRSQAIAIGVIVVLLGGIFSQDSLMVRLYEIASAAIGLMILITRTVPIGKTQHTHASLWRRWPIVSAAILVALLVAVMTLAPARSQELMSRFGILPSSGGSSSGANQASDGIADGPDTVDGSKQAQATGFSDSNVYRESHLPTLYDVVTEIYGEALKPPEDIEHSQFLGTKEVEFIRDHGVDSEQPGKRFGIKRKLPSMTPQVKECLSTALFYVEGAGPYHLRTAVYQIFDGSDWHAGPVAPDAVHQWEETGWMCPNEKLWPSRAPQVLKLQMGKMNSAIVPTPAHVQQFKLAKITSSRFFTWTGDYVIRMAKRDVPSGALLEVQYFPPNQEDYTLPVTAEPRQIVQSAELPASSRGQIGRWPHVEQIVDLVRHKYQLNPESASVDLQGFLRDGKGRDYHFATAAILALRQYGYQVRLVQGFYVPPAQVDASTGMTRITAINQHFWIELLTQSGVWIELDPTPGYVMRYAAVHWTRSLLNQIVFYWTSLKEHLTELVLFCVVAIVLFWRRYMLMDFVLVMYCHWLLKRRSAKGILKLFELLEWRALHANVCRPCHVSPQRWYGRLNNPELDRFMNYWQDVMYGPSNQHDATPDLHNMARVVIKQWTIKRLRQSKSDVRCI